MKKPILNHPVSSIGFPIFSTGLFIYIERFHTNKLREKAFLILNSLMVIVRSTESFFRNIISF